MTTYSQTATHESVSDAPLVSVVIPSYGCAQTIGAVLEALFAQTVQPLEIIVVNDRSPDDLDAAVRPYRDRITYLTNGQNLGLARSYNAGLAQATAPYVMTLHSDCILDADYIERLLAHMEQDGRIGAVTGQYLFDDIQSLALSDRMFIALNRIPPVTDRTDRSVHPVNFIEGKADLFRRSVIEQYGYFNTNLVLTAEDQELSARMRHDGYTLLQDASVRFRVMFTQTSDSLWKILYKQRTYARGQMYVMLKFGRAAFSVTTHNRKQRARHRLCQLVFSCTFLALCVIGLLNATWWWAALLLLCLRSGMYYAMSAPFVARDRLLAVVYGPLADAYYLAGAVEGFIKTVLYRKT